MRNWRLYWRSYQKSREKAPNGALVFICQVKLCKRTLWSYVCCTPSSCQPRPTNCPLLDPAYDEGASNCPEIPRRSRASARATQEYEEPPVARWTLLPADNVNVICLGNLTRIPDAGAPVLSKNIGSPDVQDQLYGNTSKVQLMNFVAFGLKYMKLYSSVLGCRI